MSFSIPLTISPTETQAVAFNEQVDIVLLDKIIASGKLQTNEWTFKEWGMKPPAKNELTLIQRYRQKFKDGSNTTSVIYYLASPTRYGRVYPQGSLSLCSFRRALRHTLAKNIYADIDIKNCQPTILHQVCISNGIDCPNLSEYVNNLSFKTIPILLDIVMLQ
jgi:hypothetical protein